MTEVNVKESFFLLSYWINFSLCFYHCHKHCFGIFSQSLSREIIGLSLKRGFDGCDGLGGLGRFSGLGGFGGFDGLSGFDEFSRLGGFGGFLF